MCEIEILGTKKEIEAMALLPDVFSVVVGEIGNEQGRIEGVCYTQTAALRMLNDSMFNGSWGKINCNGQTIERRTR